MSLDSVTIIIRSVGERTEALCKKLILEQGVPEEAIYTINETPFSKSMKIGFEIGMKENRPWTFCVDADLLLRPGSILRMVKHAERQPKNVCEIQGFVIDKFFGGARNGGVHLYRTSLLGKVIKEIPLEGLNIRPETYALNAMKNNGYPWRTVEEIVGLHDFEQAYEDIYRKCFVQAHKHLNFVELFIPFWRSKCLIDNDYHVALLGFADGIKHNGVVRIDKKAKYFENVMTNIEIGSKDDFEIDKWDLNYVETVIQNWEEPDEYWIYFPTGSLVTKSNVLFKIIQQYNWFRKKNSPSVAMSLVLSLLFKSGYNQLKQSNNFIP